MHGDVVEKKEKKREKNKGAKCVESARARWVGSKSENVKKKMHKYKKRNESRFTLDFAA